MEYLKFGILDGCLAGIASLYILALFVVVLSLLSIIVIFDDIPLSVWSGKIWCRRAGARLGSC